MAHWLFKTEPDVFGWDAQLARGETGEPWSGVRNHQANNNMKAMAVGDLGFFYHTGGERRIVGIVRVVKAHYPDPSDETAKFGMVDVTAVTALPRPVTLAEIKQVPDLADLALVKHSRLSVMPVSPEHWQILCRMGGIAKPPR